MATWCASWSLEGNPPLIADPGSLPRRKPAADLAPPRQLADRPAHPPDVKHLQLPGAGPRQAEYDPLQVSRPRRFSAGCTSLLFAARYLACCCCRTNAPSSSSPALSRRPAGARPDGGDSRPARSAAARLRLPALARPRPGRPPTAHEFADLRRHLREEGGGSFQQLRTTCAATWRSTTWSGTSYRSRDIAEQLGFPSPSAFHRAFKKWTGLTLARTGTRRKPEAQPSSHGEARCAVGRAPANGCGRPTA